MFYEGCLEVVSGRKKLPLALLRAVRFTYRLSDKTAGSPRLIVCAFWNPVGTYIWPSDEPKFIGCILLFILPS